MPVLTGVTVGAKVAVAAAALAGPDAHLILLAGEVPLAHSWMDGQASGRSTMTLDPSLSPNTPRPRRVRGGIPGAVAQ